MASATDILARPAEEFDNDPEIEMAWVMKATQHMEVYFNLLVAVDPKLLTLTKYDNEIYEQFKIDFPGFEIGKIEEATLKSKEAKEKWRIFCNRFDFVEHFNFGTILRLDCSGAYEDKNSIFVPRIQFFAIEIARNREGYNDTVGNRKPKNLEKDNSKGLLSDTICSLQNFTQFEGYTAIIKRQMREHGTLSIFIKDTNFQNLNKECLHSFASKIKNCSQMWPLPFSDSSIVRLSNVQLIELEFDKGILIRKCLATLNEQGSLYGKYIGPELNEFAYILQNNDNIRGNFLSQLLTNLLKMNGLRVEYIPNFTESQNSCLHCAQLFRTIQETIYKQIKHKVIMNNSRVSLNCESEFISSNIKLHELPSICVQDNEVFSQQFLQAVMLLHHLDCQIEKIKITNCIYYVVSHSESYRIQQLAQLWDTINLVLGRKRPKHKILVYGPVINSNGSNEYNQLYKEKVSQVEKSSNMKYESNTDHSNMQKRINTLALTALRFEILSISPSSRVLIGTDTRMGCFIQYNCARLAAIFERFKEEYEDEEKDIEPSSLIPDEYRILVTYILPFPLQMKEALQNESQILPLHKICLMLKSLSKDFSHYYSRHKVFTPNSTHNKRLLNTRITLLKGIHHVITTGLNLIDIEPLTKM